MLTLVQRKFRSERPVAILADGHFADNLAIIDDGNRVTCVALAGQGWLTVVGAAAIVDRTGDGTLIVVDTTDARLAWRSGVNDDLDLV